MQRQMQRHAHGSCSRPRAPTPATATASGFGSPSIWSCVTVPTTDTKAKSPERPEAIPW